MFKTKFEFNNDIITVVHDGDLLYNAAKVLSEYFNTAISTLKWSCSDSKKLLVTLGDEWNTILVVYFVSTRKVRK